MLTQKRRADALLRVGREFDTEWNIEIRLGSPASPLVFPETLVDAKAVNAVNDALRLLGDAVTDAKREKIYWTGTAKPARVLRETSLSLRIEANHGTILISVTKDLHRTVAGPFAPDAFAAWSSEMAHAIREEIEENKEEATERLVESATRRARR